MITPYNNALTNAKEIKLYRSIACMQLGRDIPSQRAQVAQDEIMKGILRSGRWWGEEWDGGHSGWN